MLVLDEEPLAAVELELDELVEEEPLDPVAIRLVAACIADDMFLPEPEEEPLAFDFDAFEVTVMAGLWVVVAAAAEDELLRPKSE